MVGASQYFAPRAFYALPTVAADPPFNEHLTSDTSGPGPALAVDLAAAALRMERSLVQATLTSALATA